MTAADLVVPDPPTLADTKRLEQQEAIIERGLKTFLDVGEALAAIRDERTYLAEYISFEVYCERRWGISDSRARQLIGAVATVTNVTALGAPAPTTESQARELSGLEPAVAAEVMTKAHEDTDGKVTAKAISEARGQVAPPPQPKAKVPAAKKNQWTETKDPEVLAQLDAEDRCQDFGYVLGSLEGFLTPQHRARIIAAWHIGSDVVPPHNRELHNPTTIRDLAEALTTYANELENDHA